MVVISLRDRAKDDAKVAASRGRVLLRSRRVMEVHAHAAKEKRPEANNGY